MMDFAKDVAGLIMVIILCLAFIYALGNGMGSVINIVYGEVWNGNAGMPSTLAQPVNTVLSMKFIGNETNTNDTMLEVNQSHSLFSGAPGIYGDGSVVVTHEENLAAENICVVVNGYVIGYLSDNATDSWTLSPASGFLTNGTNVVEYRNYNCVT
jgi:hypothetical protein